MGLTPEIQSNPCIETGDWKMIQCASLSKYHWEYTVHTYIHIIFYCLVNRKYSHRDALEYTDVYSEHSGPHPQVDPSCDLYGTGQTAGMVSVCGCKTSWIEGISGETETISS